MITRPALARALTGYKAPDDAVILAAPTGDFLLSGNVYQRLIPLLDGARDNDSIAELLAVDVDPAEVFYALRCLEAEGCLAEGPTAAVQSGLIQCDGLAILFGDDPLFMEPCEDFPWQFVTPIKDGFWIGPRFNQGAGGPCWRCLNIRLLGNRPLAAFSRDQALQVISPPQERLAPDSIILEKAISHSENDGLVVVGPDGKEISRHSVTQRPECPVCGDKTLYSRSAGAPVDMRSDSQAENPQTFMEDNIHLLDPITGITRGVRKLNVGVEPAVHIYIGGTNRAHTPAGLTDATRHLRSFASGKGRNDLLARASLIGEIAERHSAVFRGDEPRLKGSYFQLLDRAVHPNAIMLFSERQLAMRAALATAEDPIPRMFEEGEMVDWTPVWSLTQQRQKFVPTSLLYFGVPVSTGGSFCFADSNGNAAGATLESAMLQGLLELIERDAVGIWWFNALRRPAVSLDEIEGTWVREFVAQLSAINREVWVLDITTDIGIPAYAAVSRRTDTAPELLLFGFGSHTDARTAVLRALTELGQTLGIMQEISDSNAPISLGLRQWLERGSLQSCPFLVPAGSAPLRESVMGAGPTARAFEFCQAQLENVGLECLVLDQTRADVGIPAVKMLVPGLCHYRRRLAPGRLYSTPVKLGWVSEPNQEERLNPMALSF